MSMSDNLMYALLSMDAYNRGHGASVAVDPKPNSLSEHPREMNVSKLG